LLRRSTRQSRIPQLHNLALRRSRRRSSFLDNGGSFLNGGGSFLNGGGSFLDNGGSLDGSNLLNSGSRSRSNLLDLNSRSRSNLLYNSRHRITRFRHVIYLTTKNYSR
jgi:hypothetical protein